MDDISERRSLLAEALTPPESASTGASPSTPPPGPPLPGVDAGGEGGSESMGELVASLVDTVAAAENPEQRQMHRIAEGRNGGVGQPVGHQREVSPAAEEAVSGLPAEGDVYRGADGADVAQEQEEDVQDLLYTSPLQLLQVSAAPRLVLRLVLSLRLATSHTRGGSRTCRAGC